ncbi:hypothetical protein HYH03_007094 [Edaphochlamys debaryana]|uniref:tRNA-splicing endonuclease subunit Sen54 N-terminal domain-containing protein n=1 Tax=Edaphochlamys debaryana TaxID=47281 RepID=A0A835YC83_9CHLO|nr:hypothetical protein HYH03_007094 [Edaphochlamys debaryana]|eukprot:KAG2494854.1 hypothetical protein HYH03_007094 [Edaphochlamys debaryana]
MPLSASIFRRGGPKKELFDVTNEEVDDAKELDEKLAELDELLHADKIGREVSAALWRPHVCAAEVLRHRKQTARDMGFIRCRRAYLQIEEAVFLVDRGDLLLFIEESAPGASGPGGRGAGEAGGEADDAGGGAGEDGGDGGGEGGARRRRGGGRQRLLSIQEAFDLMMSVGVPLERFLLFSALSRSGYLVQRHPSRWLLERGEEPGQVWGGGAWAQCYGLAVPVPGAAPPQPMQQQLAARAAAAAPSAAAAVASPAAAPMDLDGPAEPRPASTAAAAGAAAAAPGVGTSSSAPAAGPAAAAAAAGGARSRGWWRAADSTHPHLAGVDDNWFEDLPPAVVDERIATALRAVCPNLQPLPSVRSALASAAAEAGAGGGGGWALAAPGPSAHLVYDVYKPGSYVSRNKGHFPAVQTHVAISSDAPPGLAELRAADAQAAAAAGAEGGVPAGVSWAAVLNGDIAFYTMGEAELLSLI